LSVEEIAALRRDVDFLAWPLNEHWRSAVRIGRFAERQCYRVDWTDDAGKTGARLFDIRTGLEVGATWNSTAETGLATTRAFSNYRAFAGILMPSTIARLDRGHEELFELTSVMLTDLALSDFAPPEGILLKSASIEKGLN
jgi:hypothetical protein